jgi:hypothetical protein
MPPSSGRWVSRARKDIRLYRVPVNHFPLVSPVLLDFSITCYLFVRVNHSSPWWWRQYVPLKRWSTSTWLQGSTSQKTLNFMQETYFINTVSCIPLYSFSDNNEHLENCVEELQSCQTNLHHGDITTPLTLWEKQCSSESVHCGPEHRHIPIPRHHGTWCHSCRFCLGHGRQVS